MFQVKLQLLPYSSQFETLEIAENDQQGSFIPLTETQ